MAPPKTCNRYKLWDFIESTTDNNLPWLIIGDFNQVLQPSDKSSGSSKIVGANKMRDVMNMKNFMDIPTVGNRFTWTNNR